MEKVISEQSFNANDLCLLGWNDALESIPFDNAYLRVSFMKYPFKVSKC